MKLLFRYLRAHWGQILMLCLFAVIFAGVFSLYRLEAEAVVYASLLCALAGVLFLLGGYVQFLRRHWLLESLGRSITFTAVDLPEPLGPLEADYQDLVQLLQRERQSLASRFDRLNRDQEAYYTAWAHQIKTPIAAMGLLLQEEDTRQSRELQAELLRIEQYVGMVLAYLRLEGDASDYLIAPCPLEPLVRQAVRKYAPIFLRKRISLELAPLEATVLTDGKWLGFVVEQLLDNALKYTAPGGTVRIFLEPEETLVIADTGIGVAPEDLPRVWDKGYTGLNGRRDRRATGIGLHLCREVLERLNHRGEMTSTLGVGTEVRIFLAHRELEVE